MAKSQGYSIQPSCGLRFPLTSSIYLGHRLTHQATRSGLPNGKACDLSGIMIHTPYTSSWSFWAVNSFLSYAYLGCKCLLRPLCWGKQSPSYIRGLYICTGRCSGLAMSPVFVRWSSSCKAQQLRFPTELLGLGYTVQETAISMTDPSTIYWPWGYGNPFQRQCFAVHSSSPTAYSNVIARGCTYTQKLAGWEQKFIKDLVYFNRFRRKSCCMPSETKGLY